MVRDVGLGLGLAIGLGMGLVLTFRVFGRAFNRKIFINRLIEQYVD